MLEGTVYSDPTGTAWGYLIRMIFSGHGVRYFNKKRIFMNTSGHWIRYLLKNQEKEVPLG